MTRYQRGALLGAVAATHVLLVSPAFAQQGAAVLTGTVVDAATKQGVPDVVVTVTSPALQGEQIVVTDSTGQYRIPNLPSGDYTMRLEKEGYQPFSRSDIRLRADVTIRVDQQLLPEAIQGQEEVVVARAPTVDVGSSSTGMNISSDFTRRIPVAPPGGKGTAQRSFESVAEVTPGARADTYGTSINGATSPENQYVIDGLSVNNPMLGIIGTPLSTEFVGEVNVLSGGYMPEYGRATGGVLSAVTKSGSNEFHGGVWSFLSPGALEGNRKLVRREGQTILTQPKLLYQGDVGFDIGGPIAKDKLWFYAGVDVSRTVYNLDRNLYRTVVGPDGKPVKDDLNFTETTVIPGTFQRYQASATSLQTLGKLTYTVDENNKLTLTGIYSPTFSGGGGDFGLDPTTGGPEVANIAGTQSALAHKYVGGALDTSLKWTSEKNNKTLLFDTTVGWHHEEGGRRPSDGSTIGSRDGLAGLASVAWRRNKAVNGVPGYHSINDFEQLPDPSVCDPAGTPAAVLCPVQNYLSGGPDYIDQQTMNRWQARHVITYLTQWFGHHVIKGGVDVEFSQFDHIRAYSGGRRFRESTSGASFSDQRQYGFMQGPDNPVILDSLRWKTNTVDMGGFLQDSWAIQDKVTVNVGVRYDTQYIFGGDGQLAMALPNQISPRVGAIWDPTQQGRAKVFGNWARYYESVPLDLADRAGSSEPQITSTHPASSCDPRDPAQQRGSCMNDANRAVIGSKTSPDQKWVVTGAGKTPIDPDLKPQSSDEIVVGGEYELFKDARVGLSYTKRWMNNVIEDMSRDEAQTYFIGNPGSGIAKDFPKAERNYDAATVYFSKIFSDDWLAQVSYTISYLRGNYAGLFRPETGQLDPNINSDFDLRSLLVNRTGPLPGDHTHDIKMYGARDIELPEKMHLNLGLGFTARSGTPSSYLGSHPLYGADEVFLLERGAGPRLPWNFGVDTNIGYGFRWTKDQTVTITMDVFNLLNFQAETVRDERYTASDVNPIPGARSRSALNGLKDVSGDAAITNPNFGNPLAYQRPRTFRFGIRATF